MNSNNTSDFKNSSETQLHELGCETLSSRRALKNIEPWLKKRIVTLVEALYLTQEETPRPKAPTELWCEGAERSPEYIMKKISLAFSRRDLELVEHNPQDFLTSTVDIYKFMFWAIRNGFEIPAEWIAESPDINPYFENAVASLAEAKIQIETAALILKPLHPALSQVELAEKIQETLGLKVQLETIVRYMRTTPRSSHTN